MIEGLQAIDPEYEERMLAFEMDCDKGKGDAWACHSVGEFLAVVKVRLSTNVSGKCYICLSRFPFRRATTTRRRRYTQTIVQNTVTLPHVLIWDAYIWAVAGFLRATRGRSSALTLLVKPGTAWPATIWGYCSCMGKTAGTTFPRT